jgi:hypothetical protein
MWRSTNDKSTPKAAVCSCKRGRQWGVWINCFLAVVLSMTIAYQYLPFIFGIYLVPPRSQTPIHLTNGLVMVGTNAPLRPTADIIFVHGLGSLPDSTWHKPLPGQKTKYPEGVHWVRDLLPSDIPDARLMFFNYDSTVYNDAPQKSLRTIGDELLLALEHSKADASAWQQEIPIIFVCHSFGGLVVKEVMSD